MSDLVHLACAHVERPAQKRRNWVPIAPLGIISDGLHDPDMCESQERTYLPDNALTPCQVLVSCAKATEEVVAVVATMTVA